MWGVVHRQRKRSDQFTAFAKNNNQSEVDDDDDDIDLKCFPFHVANGYKLYMW